MKKIIPKILKFGTLFSTLGFVACVFIQIYTRFFLESTPSWTEEASRLFFIYAMSFSAGLALKENYYVQLDFFYDKLNDKQKKIINILSSFSIFILFIIIAIFDLQYVGLGLVEKSPSMGISMSIAFVSIFIMSISICVYALFDLIKSLKQFL